MRSRPSSKAPLGALILLGLLVPGAVGRLAAEPWMLPVELPLTAGEIVLELDHAAVEVVVDPAAAPALRAGLYDESAPPLSLEVSREGGALTVRRGAAPAEGEEPRPLWLVLVVGPSHRLEVRGTALGLTLDATDLASGVGTPRLSLDVGGSQVRLDGVAGASVTARESRIDVSASSGTVSLDLDGGRAVVSDHRGPLRLDGRNATAQVLRHQGRLDFDLQASDLTVQASDQPLGGRSEGGSVLLASWSGTASVDADRAVVQVQGVHGKSSQLRMGGDGVTLLADGFEGDLTAELTAGRFDGTDLSGTVRIVGRGRSAVTVQDAAKVLDLDLSEGSTGEVIGMDGRCSARLTDATFDAEAVRLLAITAVRSEATASGVVRLETVRAHDSRITLDLSGVEGHPAVLLDGRSEARVRLPMPCQVRMAARVKRERVEERLRVSGCETWMPGSGLRPVWGGEEEEMVILKATLSEESALEVTGVARP